MSPFDVLYAHPELYEALRPAEPERIEALWELLTAALGEPPRRVLDPACGPGHWLVGLARHGAQVAGNDLSPEMAAAARAQLSEFPGHEVTEGDMRRLVFSRRDFCAAVEMAGSVSLLTKPDDLVEHMGSVAAHLRAGGVYVMALLAGAGGVPLIRPEVYWDSGPVRVNGSGLASIRYTVLDRDVRTGMETMQRTVEVKGIAGCPPRFEDRYMLKGWERGDLERVIARVPAFALMGIYDAEDEFLTRKDPKFKGQTIAAVLRKR